MSDLFEKLLILRTPKIGPVRYAQLIEKFGCIGAVNESLNHSIEFMDSVRREMDMAHQMGIIYISEDDPLYPENLLTIKNHPIVLTARGNLSALSKPSVAIVGTRHASAAGLKFTSDLSHSFADNGHVVISGMAMGTDTAAHNGALRADGDAVTIAVLAGGADYIWPLENESLYQKITERGVVISEMPPGFQPDRGSFAQRNRWVAGLCDKLILGEADSKSGSMITTRFAIEYKKPVFAIPSHPSDARSAGPNQLIADGSATLCMGKNDFFGDKSNQIKQKASHNNAMENDVLDKLGMIPLSESVLAELVKKNVVEIKAQLVVLELQGLVKKIDGGYIRI